MRHPLSCSILALLLLPAHKRQIGTQVWNSLSGQLFVASFDPLRAVLEPSRRLRAAAVVATICATVALFVGRLLFVQSGNGIGTTAEGFAVDFEKLGGFDFDPKTGTLDDVPQAYRKLDGKRIAIEGFIFAPSGDGDQVSNFQFVHKIASDNRGPPRVQRRVLVTVPNGKGVNYSPDEVRIIGILHIDIQHDESGNVMQVFSMDLDRVEPL